MGTMSATDLFLLAGALSMDAFAVSACKGMAAKRVDWKGLLIVGLWFGGFQALMPGIGYLLGSFCEEYISVASYWIAFLLLGYVGGKMVFESFGNGKEEKENASLAPVVMFFLAVATSVDALAAGITFAFLDLRLIFTLALIGITTFVFSDAGFLLGRVIGKHATHKSECIGGVILLFLGTKILLEGLGVF
jgi:putative Mn2+ efflux pump MntP